MPNYWIVKTEPSTYSFDDLARQKTSVWDGVKNSLALKHLRQMKSGDRVLVYHTGDEKAQGPEARGGGPESRREIAAPGPARRD
jgi:predicted RNA-binding protein with PUA-like domain